MDEEDDIDEEGVDEEVCVVLNVDPGYQLASHTSKHIRLSRCLQSQCENVSRPAYGLPCTERGNFLLQSAQYVPITGKDHITRIQVRTHIGLGDEEHDAMCIWSPARLFPGCAIAVSLLYNPKVETALNADGGGWRGAGTQP